MNANIFELPYIGYHENSGMEMLYNEQGDFSVIMRITNPALHLHSDEMAYASFHELLIKLIKMLGEGHLLQKQDVFSAGAYQSSLGSEYLQRAYDEHFQGRGYYRISTYLCITREVEKGRFYVYDDKAPGKFYRDVSRAVDLLKEAGAEPELLSRNGMERYIAQCLSMDFFSDLVAKNNISVKDNQLDMGEVSVRCISLIDSDAMDLPGTLGSYQLRNDGKAMRNFAMDNLTFLHQVPGYRCMIYNQIISIPSQRMTLAALSLKQKRHSGIPDPANRLCVEDISALLSQVARDNQLLIHAHFNIIFASQGEKLEETANFIESSLFSIGIIPGRNAYNQLELFKSSLPGNASAFQGYDKVLLPSEAALCLFFKERLAESERSDFLIRFTDRSGIPIAIDPADLPMETGRISNRSKFVLGGSGSGKSFFMNSLIEQYLLYNMDVVIVDTGHSYSGLCAYYNGRYLTYSEQQPITMNPFAFSKEEYNIEKRDYLKTLIFLLLKGASGQVDTIEDTVISRVISAFYARHFLAENQGSKLDFDAFYVFSADYIAEIIEKDRIFFDLDAYRFVLRKFCRGEEFGELLNLPTDSSLLTEKFVVFEIDAIREHKVIFPIITLIIMDVFLQKMRLRHHRRKALILEEAWVRREVA